MFQLYRQIIYYDSFALHTYHLMVFLLAIFIADNVAMPMMAMANR